MNVTYTGGTGQQRAWAENAIAHMQFPWDALASLEVNFSWPVEPSAAGHKEYACTVEGVDANHFAIEIRRAFDDPDYMRGHPPFDELGDTHPVDVQRFYVESVAHELGHVLAFHAMATMTSDELDALCACFQKRASGVGSVIGTQADLHPAGAKWEDMLQEGIAETLKDILLPDALREFDNRTNWKLKKESFEDFSGFFLPEATEPAGRETVLAFWNGGVSGDYIDPHVDGVIVVNDHSNHLDPALGYPRFRWIGEDALGLTSGVRDFTDFWDPAVWLGLIPGHTQTLDFGMFYDDTSTFSAAGAYILDHDAPLEGTPPGPHQTGFIGGMTGANPFHGAFGGIFQVSQFMPTPQNNALPPWPYRDPAITAAGSLRAAIQLQTRSR